MNTTYSFKILCVDTITATVNMQATSWEAAVADLKQLTKDPQMFKENFILKDPERSSDITFKRVPSVYTMESLYDGSGVEDERAVILIGDLDDNQKRYLGLIP